MFDSDSRCVVIVGSQWGDEGKGKIVDALAPMADLVVRYQGGANAGHTVITSDGEFILHQIPSGILHPGCICVIGNGVVLDPATLVDEIDSLAARGVDLTDRLRISDRAHVVLPYHRLLDRAAELTQKIGTTGRGIGPTYEDKYGRRGVRVSDLLSPARLEKVIGVNVARANQVLQMLGSEDRANVEEHLELCGHFAERVGPLSTDTGALVYDALKAGRSALMEGAQGALLDVDHGTYPYVTSSNTTSGGAAVGAGIGPTMIDSVLGVVKAYTTRVGNGPLPTEESDELGEKLRKLGGEFGATTGRPRRCGWFDSVVARYAARVNGLTHLAVTKLDVLDTFDEIKICTGYELDGTRIQGFPSDPDQLERVVPVYETMEGWESSTCEAQALDELPGAARTYLDRLVDLVGVPVRYVSVGGRREQLIRLG